MLLLCSQLVQSKQKGGGEYITTGSDYRTYVCADGEQIFDPEEVIENDGRIDCVDGSDEGSNGSGVVEI